MKEHQKSYFFENFEGRVTNIDLLGSVHKFFFALSDYKAKNPFCDMIVILNRVNLTFDYYLKFIIKNVIKFFINSKDRIFFGFHQI